MGRSMEDKEPRIERVPDMERLNLGCGEFYAEGWTNVDCHPVKKVDVVAWMSNLPFPDCCASQIYCGHVLEHVYEEDLAETLKEITRVLSPLGELLVVGPDINRARDRDTKKAIIGGAGRWPGDEHRWICSEKKMLEHLTKVFEVLPFPVSQVDAVKWPIVSHVYWQFAIHCFRKQGEI